MKRSLNAALALLAIFMLAVSCSPAPENAAAPDTGTENQENTENQEDQGTTENQEDQGNTENQEDQGNTENQEDQGKPELDEQGFPFPPETTLKNENKMSVAERNTAISDMHAWTGTNISHGEYPLPGTIRSEYRALFDNGLFVYGKVTGEDHFLKVDAGDTHVEISGKGTACIYVLNGKETAPEEFGNDPAVMEIRDYLGANSEKPMRHQGCQEFVGENGSSSIWFQYKGIDTDSSIYDSEFDGFMKITTAGTENVLEAHGIDRNVTVIFNGTGAEPDDLFQNTVYSDFHKDLDAPTRFWDLYYPLAEPYIGSMT